MYHILVKSEPEQLPSLCVLTEHVATSSGTMNLWSSMRDLCHALQCRLQRRQLRSISGVHFISEQGPLRASLAFAEIARYSNPDSVETPSRQLQQQTKEDWRRREERRRSFQPSKPSRDLCQATRYSGLRELRPRVSYTRLSSLERGTLGPWWTDSTTRLTRVSGAEDVASCSSRIVRTCCGGGGKGGRCRGGGPSFAFRPSFLRIRWNSPTWRPAIQCRANAGHVTL
jgi:hypothetical protein